jgi:O-antigen/teichoic acid export membrane protein
MQITGIIRIFFKGNTRSVKAKKNIVGAMFLKGCSILVSFILVPMTLGYLNKFEYGIWLTLSSVLMWINYFDVGLGNGLRNKLAEALALGDIKLARIYVSTTFFLLTVVMLVIYLFFLVSLIWVDWHTILNVPENFDNHNLNSLVAIVFMLFCVSFILKCIGNVYLATQLPVVNDLLMLAGNVISLLIIYILTKTTQGDLSKVAITYSVAPVLVYLLAYPITFYLKYPYLRPAISSIKIKYTKNLIGLGVQFFIIQISCLIVFSTSNILISHLFGPEQVTPYNIAYKYFMVITMIFGIIITPIWSAITDAYTKNDYTWIKQIIRKNQYIWLGLFILTIVMVAISKFVYRFWVGNEIEVPISLSLTMGIYVTISNWNNIYAYFVNGVGKIKLQLYISIFTTILYIPLAIGLSHLWGIDGIIGAMCIVLLLSGIVLPKQYLSIINRKAKGIWGG